MKKNYVLIFTFVAICLLTVFTPVRKVVKRVLNDLSDVSSKQTYLTASFNYLDNTGKKVENVDDVIYVFLSQNKDFTDGNRVTIKLRSNSDEQKVTQIYDQNGELIKNGDENHKIDGTYYVKVGIPKSGYNDSEVSESYKFNSSDYDVYNTGDTYNGSYIINYSSEINISSNEIAELTIEVRERNGKRVSSSDMMNPMDLATSFGVFALKFNQSADIEATIGVETFESNIDHTFGLSLRNYEPLEKVDKLGRIKVNKVYTKNTNIPVEDKKVTIILKDSNGIVSSQDCTTNENGVCSVEFEDLDVGIYNIEEKIGDTIIETSKTIVDEDGKNIEVKFSNESIEIKSSTDFDKVVYNYNYVANIGSDASKVNLAKMRKPGTLVLGTDELVSTYTNNQEFNTQNENERVVIAKAGTPGYKTIDFKSEFDNLKNLSIYLSETIDSNDVKVHYVDYKKIENAELDFNSDDKEYILVNVDCTNADEVKIGGRHKRDGKLMVNEGDSFEYNEAAKVIYNFYVHENGTVKPYDKSITTSGATTGIILAPSATVNGASSNHSGTIIASYYNHTEGEVHQKVNFEKISSSSINTSIINNIIEQETEEHYVDIGKVDTNNNPIEGAIMQLLDEDNKVIESWTSTKDLHRVTNELTIGESYIVHEEKPPIGYQKANDYTFVYSGQEAITYNMVDTKIIISKLDENKNYLLGATLQILDDKGNIVEQWISGLEDYIVQQPLEPGKTYRLHEYKAPEGYKTANDIEFTLSSDGKDQTIVMEDQKISITVKVDKKDINEKQLAGAHLQILDIYGNVVDEWISDGTIHEVENKLEEGKKYKLHELEAPAGYQISEDIEFTVKTTEKDQIVEMVDEKIVIPGEPKVIIKKTNQNKELLEGATLQILDKDGKLIEEWTTNDKEHVIQANLIAGQKYTLHEVSAPKGYKQAEDITFVAKSSDEPQVINMVDKRVKAVLGVVETLDKIARYETMFAITLSLVLLGLYIYRKYNKKYTE